MSTCYRKSCWYEEATEENLRWSIALYGILQTGKSKYHDFALLDTKPFGKALVIDGKLQSTEVDGKIYHECLVHPPLLHHPNPKTIFIMGGYEGSTTRQVLKHQTVDKELVEFCKSYMDDLDQKAAFSDPRLVINEISSELQSRKEFFDVIIGDLEAVPIEGGGPCYEMYTKSFYEFVVKPRLNPGGIFVTQAGPAGFCCFDEGFSWIYNTLRQVFKYVFPYSAHIPSFADTWGWVMASDSPFRLSAEELDMHIETNMKGYNVYVDGKTIISSFTFSNAVRNWLDYETGVYE